MHHQDLCNCAAMSSIVGVRIDGWDIHGRWFGIAVERDCDDVLRGLEGVAAWRPVAGPIIVRIARYSVRQGLGLGHGETPNHDRSRRVHGWPGGVITGTLAR
jgi:hypothetical protein